jgi:HSP20 family molecular chaperone IbpA
MEVSLPGYCKADLEITFEDNILKIQNINPSKPDKILKYRIPGRVDKILLSMEYGLLSVSTVRIEPTVIRWLHY